jgi:guanosine-3',5'-bis(diphosphate) 3'-pyrophosphohydrolase
VATIERALQIAAKAHEGQKDKSGKPYIFHPLRAMMSVEGEEAQIVAILHDVIEDTSVTVDDLRQAGFSEKTIEGVLCVTHRKDETYADYVVRCKGNGVARRVKLADLEDNSRLDRNILRPQ